MSTLNVSTIIPDAGGSNVDLSLDGKGTGKVAIVDDASVGGDATVAGGSVTMTGTLPTLTIHDNSATTYTEGNDAAAIDFKIRSSDPRTGASIRMFNNSTNGTGMGLTIDTLDGDSAIETLRLQDRDVNVKSGNLLFGTASKGVYLGVTSATASNLLDDYEEGTWTPAQNGVTAAAASGAYTKIGRLVIANFTMTTATTSDTSSMQISGLPFACATIDGSVALGYDNYAVSNTSHAYVANGTSYIQMIQNSSGASTNAVHTGKLLKGSAIYYSAT